ncbi:MAG TPA: site-specific integrase, partial [Cyclobacteriaceae bacterium]|nr:site-specific integrase [Cyclobacteriaceae bacterium]
LRAKAFGVQRKLLTKEMPITIENFKDEWLGRQSNPKMLLDVFAQHNAEFKQLVGRQYSHATWKRYSTSLRHTKAFMQDKYGRQDIALCSIQYKFITDYDFWLRTTRQCGHNTAIKYLANFRKIINICLKNRWIDKDPFIGFSMAKKEVERFFLTSQELHRIASTVLRNERLIQVRDVFLFCCYTGLAYSDVQALTPEQLVIGVDGERWIFTHRRKTDVSSKVPLLPIALEIVERYRDHPECQFRRTVFPVPTNQKMNAYLKEIADLCVIKKYLTSHMARHTFATTVTLTNGVPMESVSKMLGHRSLRTTQLYAKVLDEKVSEDMMALRERLESRSITSTVAAID